ncbi:hypothetical protein ACJRO7_004761 [Eucalyptus globulus]|uniref:Uncharacterized protein n=1 Tax=Eucalyptus globulus TaxID=34317 RepID=A0ABD3J0R5_EUCGL
MALTTQNSNPIIVPCGHKPVRPPRYSITAFDLENGLVALGGWDLATYEPVADVFAYNFAARGGGGGGVGVPMPRRASFFAVGAHSGRVYVAEGHNEGKNKLRSAWAYDVGRGEWAELPPMSHGRDKCEGQSFWVVSGYRTEDQGRFEGGAEVYDFGTRGMAAGGEGVATGVMPELARRRGEGRTAVRLVRVDPTVGAEMCRFYVAEGQNKKLERINVPNKFSEFAQTGCRVEV